MISHTSFAVSFSAIAMITASGIDWEIATKAAWSFSFPTSPSPSTASHTPRFAKIIFIFTAHKL
ncbi:hypothetical protein Syun_000711 [Stephania yunnanensis]|uniref:Secreted protein n=1 Tax=Stephania yunnanensis TaxID=152371 RepID=A0AAP0LCR0_9MAGN